MFIYIFAVRRYNAFLHAMTEHGRGGEGEGGRGEGGRVGEGGCEEK